MYGLCSELVDYVQKVCAGKVTGIQSWVTHLLNHLLFSSRLEGCQKFLVHK